MIMRRECEIVSWLESEVGGGGGKSPKRLSVRLACACRCAGRRQRSKVEQATRAKTTESLFAWCTIYPTAAVCSVVYRQRAGVAARGNSSAHDCFNQMTTPKIRGSTRTTCNAI